MWWKRTLSSSYRCYLGRRRSGAKMWRCLTRATGSAPALPAGRITALQALDVWKRHFVENGVTEPEQSSQYIVAHLLGAKTIESVEQQRLAALLSKEETQQVWRLCSKRLSRMPVQFVIEEWDFRDLTLKMRPPVFIPRPETEELVELVLTDLQKHPGSAEAPPTCLEVGCGSGAISLSLLKSLPQDAAPGMLMREFSRGSPGTNYDVTFFFLSLPTSLFKPVGSAGCGSPSPLVVEPAAPDAAFPTFTSAFITAFAKEQSALCFTPTCIRRFVVILVNRCKLEAFALERSQDAVDLSRENAARLGLQDRLKVYHMDVIKDADKMPGLFSSISVLVSNPPYLFSEDMATLEPEISRFEDRAALDGGEDGLNVIRQILTLAPDVLSNRGRVYLEVDPRHPALIRRWVEDNVEELRFVETRPDVIGRPRFCILQKEESHKAPEVDQD